MLTVVILDRFRYWTPHLLLSFIHFFIFCISIYR